MNLNYSTYFYIYVLYCKLVRYFSLSNSENETQIYWIVSLLDSFTMGTNVRLFLHRFSPLFSPCQSPCSTWRPVTRFSGSREGQHSVSLCHLFACKVGRSLNKASHQTSTNHCSDQICSSPVLHQSHPMLQESYLKGNWSEFLFFKNLKSTMERTGQQ